MIALIGRALGRLAAMIGVMIAALLFTFVLVRLLPGDPAAGLLTGPGAGRGDLMALRHSLGLDQPLLGQLGDYLAAVLRGDLGSSFVTGRPVVADLGARLPASLELAGAAMVLALGLALPAGLWAAVYPGGWGDRFCRLLIAAGAALPAFVSGLILIQLFYFTLGWLPEPVGRLDPWALPPPTVTGFLTLDSLLAGAGASFADALAHLALPAATMALFAVSPLARISRAALLAVLRADDLDHARALGLPRWRLLWSYALPQALVPIITGTGLVLSAMLGANVLVEKLFAWPGVSAYAADALLAADYPPVQGFILLTAGIFALITLIVDLLHGLIDPRQRARR